MAILKPEGKNKKEYETQDGLAYLTHCYRDRGMDDDKVAAEIGITRKTLYNWRKSSQAIKNAIEIGKSIMDQKVENILLQQALQGDVTAIIFWLKNRKPDQWRDVRRNEISGKIETSPLKDLDTDEIRKIIRELDD